MVPVSTCVVRIIVGRHGVVLTILRHPSPDADVDSQLMRMRRACDALRQWLSQASRGGELSPYQSDRFNATAFISTRDNFYGGAKG